MLKDFTKETFDIIIQGGQSNAEGCGMGAVEFPFEMNPDIYQMDGDFIISKAREVIWGNEVIGNFVLPFAANYVKDRKLKTGRKLLILLTAVGGTGFFDNRWGKNDDLFLRMTEMIKTALDLNPANRVVAFVWHQGETDTNAPDRDVHYNNLHYLVSSVRKTAKEESLPFVAGDFVHHWKMNPDNLNRCIPIIKAIKDLCTDIGNAAFTETDGLLSNDEKTGNGDDIHFCREALYEMGNRYYKAFSTICYP